ncbi:MAG: DNA recombination protein RmuC [Gammaproteobacteria bacterium]|nr:MAG: DNA recombination protein RmuC [Gammaproteobacteria bacterium]
MSEFTQWLNQIAPGGGILVLGAVFGAGLLLGLALCWLLAGRRLKRQLRALTEQAAALEAQLKTEAALAAEREAALARAEERLADKFSKLAHESLSRHSESFLRLARENLGKQQQQAAASLSEREQAVAQLIKPIQQALEKTHEQISAIEKERHVAFGSIRAQLENMAQNQQSLRAETQRLVKALRRPEVRGQWGEITLRRLVELAGMVQHCDFTEQAHTRGRDGALRPDMVVHLPDRGEIVVDVKTPLDAYLEAVEAPDDEARASALQRHARNVAHRVRELSSKAYWAQFERSPEFVILFIPGDQFLTAALNEDPALLDQAMQQKVILATPTSLMALLKAVAYGWRQLALADNAEEIRRLAVELYTRLGTFTEHMVKLGKQLGNGVDAYNKAIGSLERMVLPGARKFTELGIHAKKDIPQTTTVDTAVRAAANGPELPKLENQDDDEDSDRNAAY